MKSIQILGCRVDAIGRDAAVERVAALARSAPPSLVVTLGTEMVIEARKNPAFRAAIEGAALVVCDTIGLLVASRLRGGPLHERVTGVDLVWGLAARSAADDLRIYLLGGRDDTAVRAATALRSRYPQVRIVGTSHGYFSSSAEVAAAIRAGGANVLLAGLGSPKQELWLAEHLAATGCGVGIGIGGALDILAGNVRRAPRGWQRLGLEWLYRLACEPKRWRRQLALPAFAVLALRESVALRLSRGKGT